MAGLRERLLSGIALAAVLVAAAMWLPLPWLAAFLHLLALVAAYEWAKLAGVGSRLGFVAYATLLSALALAMWAVPSAWPLIVAVVAACWLAAAAAVWAFPASGALLRPPVVLAAGIVIIAGAWLALLAIRAAGGGLLLLWLLAATSLADIGAYFAGRRYGKRKLAPQVSPNKTWEGLLGGTAATLAWGAAAAIALGGWLWLVAALVVAAAAVLGDLFESVLKRIRGVAESGGILPGHGGLLDRADSVLAAAPVFALLLPFLLGLPS